MPYDKHKCVIEMKKHSRSSLKHKFKTSILAELPIKMHYVSLVKKWTQFNADLHQCHV